MSQTWVIVLLTLVTIFLLAGEVVLVVMFVGVFKKVEKLEDICRAMIDGQVRTYTIHRSLIRTLARTESHLARWYNQATGLNWAFDPELDAERKLMGEEMRKAEDKAKKEEQG